MGNLTLQSAWAGGGSPFDDHGNKEEVAMQSYYQKKGTRHLSAHNSGLISISINMSKNHIKI